MPQHRRLESTSTISSVALILLLIFCAGSFRTAKGFTQEARRASLLSPAQVRAVVLAVEDEIYDYGYQKSFQMVGKQAVPGVTRLPLYMRPTLTHGEGAVIYKLMPLGEVVRDFHFDKNGLAVLEGDPSSHFPPTQPNTLTLYMDDDDVCRWKRTWSKQYFEILDSPPVQRVKVASDRQIHRVGFSAAQSPPASDRKSPPQN